VEYRSKEASVDRLDAVHSAMSEAQRELFSLIVEADTAEVWKDCGARDLAHWLSMRYGISVRKAHRWIAAAHALKTLPLISGAFARGELGVDKVVELTRLATPQTEAGLIPWAKNVAGWAIRRRADLASRQSVTLDREADRSRFLDWWYIEDSRRLGLHAEFPAAQGAVVVKAIERLAQSIPVMPGEEEACYASARRADALAALAGARIAEDADPDRATMVVHARMGPTGSIRGAAEIEDGPVIHPETARRLACTARIQVIGEDQAGNIAWVGKMSGEPPPWMMRQLRYRDQGCIFSGCGTRRFTVAHHLIWRSHGGPHELENLVLLCTGHHKLVHEYGWRVTRARGTVRWFHPDGPLTIRDPPRRGQLKANPFQSWPRLDAAAERVA
jgi:hypothetical protein